MTLIQKMLGEKYYKLFCQFFKFCLVGGINTLVDSAVFSLCFYIIFKQNTALQPIAFALGYTFGLICSYILNKLWTFKEKSTSSKQIIVFIIINIVAFSLGLGELSLLKTVSIIGIEAKLLSVPLTLLVNFIGNKLFVFKN